jgi:hypothetical protein
VLPHRAPVRVRRTLLVAVAVCAALAGCAGDRGDDAAPVTTPPTSAPAADPGALEPLVLDDAPSGFALAPDDAGATGRDRPRRGRR